jgi:hypothetical protein
MSARRATRPARSCSLDDWQQLFALADRYDFVIASDECYSEIFGDETQPPLGCLQAARLLGRGDQRLVMFSSLSKRSNVPGMRSGFVAGDPALLKSFLLYRTYHGSAMNPAVQAASIAAWNDEAHVVENRRQYREKFAAVTPRLAEVLDTALPDAGFYLWARTPIERRRVRPRTCSLTIMWSFCPAATLARTRMRDQSGRRFRAHRTGCAARRLRRSRRTHPFIRFKTLGKQPCRQSSKSSMRPGKTAPRCNPATPTKAFARTWPFSSSSTKAPCALPRRSTASGSPTNGSRKPSCSPSG